MAIEIATPAPAGPGILNPLHAFAADTPFPSPLQYRP